MIIAFVIPGFIFGFKKFWGHRDPVAAFKKFGYPLWFMHTLGFAEITGSALMLFNATRVYGIAIFPFILAGAAYTHLKVKDGNKIVMKPLLAGLHLLIIFLFTFLISGICIIGL